MPTLNCLPSSEEFPYLSAPGERNLPQTLSSAPAERYLTLLLQAPAERYLTQERHLSQGIIILCYLSEKELPA